MWKRLNVDLVIASLTLAAALTIYNLLPFWIEDGLATDYVVLICFFCGGLLGTTVYMVAKQLQ